MVYKLQYLDNNEKVKITKFIRLEHDQYECLRDFIYTLPINIIFSEAP